MMIFKKAIPRRAFLQGLGTTLALPLMDSMIPAFAAATDAAAQPARRLSVVYVNLSLNALPISFHPAFFWSALRIL